MQIEHPLKDERFEGKTQTIASNRIVSYAISTASKQGRMQTLISMWANPFTFRVLNSKNGTKTNECQSANSF